MRFSKKGGRLAGRAPWALKLAALAGLQESGLASCLKHWPGHGGTLVDTHHEAAEAVDPEAVAPESRPVGGEVGPHRDLPCPDGLGVEDHEVRVAAAKALGYLGLGTSAEALRALFDDWLARLSAAA